jgi:hypothetical protein
VAVSPFDLEREVRAVCERIRKLPDVPGLMEAEVDAFARKVAAAIRKGED